MGWWPKLQSLPYRIVSVKILDEFPNVMGGVASQLARQRDQFGISVESWVDGPLATIEGFNRQFQLGKMEQFKSAWIDKVYNLL
jgi:hypothetical protein